MAWNDIFLGFVLITALVVLGWLAYEQSQEREQLRHTANQEGVGEEFELELTRQLELQGLRPKDTSSGRDPYREALRIVRLHKQVMTKNTISSNGATQLVTLDISGNTIAALNLGTVVGDLTASVQTLQTHGHEQIAHAIEALTAAIGESKEIKDGDRKDLLENLALVSNEAASLPAQRRPGLLRSSLSFITTSLAASIKLIPLVHDLHEKLKASGVIDR